MKFNLHKFKKVSSDANKTVLQHPGGHQITIAHKALSPKMREQLSALPTHSESSPKMMAEGGDVSSDIQDIDMNQQPKPLEVEQISPPEVPAQPQMAAMEDSSKAAPVEASSPPPPVSDPVTSDVPNRAPASSTPPPSPQSDPFGVEAYSQEYNKGIEHQRQGIEGEARSAKIQADATIGAMQKAQDNQQVLQKTFQDHVAALDQERQHIQHDIEQGHIDPKRYINNMTDGQRTMSTIGLILGGMGSAMAHQENLGAKMLMHNIDADIEAQKAELGKNENLLSANSRQFGNLRDATDMTRLMSIEMVKNQLTMAAAKAQDPLAKARALQAVGELEQKAAPIISQNAMRKSLLSGMQNGQVAPEHVVNMLVPEHQRAEANKELVTAQNMTAVKDNALSAFDRVNQMHLGGALSPHQRNALVSPILAQMVKDSEGRITPQDVPMIEALFPSATDMGDTRELKRTQLNKFLGEKMNFPILKTYGINPGALGQFNRQGQSKFQESAPIIPKK